MLTLTSLWTALTNCLTKPHCYGIMYADSHNNQEGYLRNSNLASDAANWPRLYAILNDDAKSWWYHKKLASGTSQDQLKGRELERRSIRSAIHTLKEWRQHNTTLHWHEASGQYSSDDVPTYDPTTRKVNGSHSMSFGGCRHGNGLAIAAHYMGLTITNSANAPHTRKLTSNGAPL